MGTRGSRRRPSIAAVALAIAAQAAGCGDMLLSKESKREIAAVRAAVEANAEAVNQPTPTGELPIVVAVRTGSSSLTAWLIARGASPVARGAHGRTPLHDLVIYDRPPYEALRAMLTTRGVDANVADDRGVTPVHVAAQVLRSEAVDILVRAGADPNRPDSWRGTPLHELGALLLPPDASLPPPNPKSAIAQPAAAAATMDSLLKAGGRLDAADARGMRPLHVYALSGNVAAVRAALARGADVSAVDARGRTPLFQAAAFGHTDVVSLLLAAGADVRHRDVQGLTALGTMRYTAPTPQDAPKVAVMLKAAGATEPEQLPEAVRHTSTRTNAGVAAATPQPAPIKRDQRREGLARAQSSASDWMIVPGERVGPITATTSEAMLGEIFGPDNVEPVTVDVGEGLTEPGTAVYPGDAARRIAVFWRDEGRTAVKKVLVRGDVSKWKTPEGISLGSTLREIERLNGSPFTLLGFAFDYGGSITDCGRGRLRMLGWVDRDGAHQGQILILRLGPRNEARARPEYGLVKGDRRFSSGHPAMQVLNPGVYEMWVYLSR